MTSITVEIKLNTSKLAIGIDYCKEFSHLHNNFNPFLALHAFFKYVFQVIQQF